MAHTMTKRVEIGDWGSIWDAITDTESFTVCWPEEYNGGECIATAPGWGSWGALGLFFAEIVFWLIFLLISWKKLKRRINSPTIDEAERAIRPDSPPLNGFGGKGSGK